MKFIYVSFTPYTHSLKVILYNIFKILGLAEQFKRQSACQYYQKDVHKTKVCSVEFSTRLSFGTQKVSDLGAFLDQGCPACIRKF
jgi:hypothetical protein